MKMETFLPQTLTFPSGIVLVKDAFEPCTHYAIYPEGERNFTEFLQKQIDAGQVEKSK